MNKLATTKEETERFRNLGIPVDAFADMYYDKSGNLLVGSPYSITDTGVLSIQALLNLLPSEFTLVNQYGTYGYYLNMCSDKRTVGYGNYNQGGQFKDMINYASDNIVDSLYHILVYLIEHGMYMMSEVLYPEVKDLLKTKQYNLEYNDETTHGNLISQFWHKHHLCLNITKEKHYYTYYITDLRHQEIEKFQVGEEKFKATSYKDALISGIAAVLQLIH